VFGDDFALENESLSFDQRTILAERGLEA